MAFRIYSLLRLFLWAESMGTPDVFHDDMRCFYHVYGLGVHGSLQTHELPYDLTRLGRGQTTYPVIMNNMI